MAVAYYKNDFSPSSINRGREGDPINPQALLTLLFSLPLSYSFCSLITNSLMHRRISVKKNSSKKFFLQVQHSPKEP